MNENANNIRVKLYLVKLFYNLPFFFFGDLHKLVGSCKNILTAGKTFDHTHPLLSIHTTV